MASLRPHGAYRLVAVEDLPHAHNPHRCDQLGSFRALQQRQQRWRKRLPRRLWPLLPIASRPVGELWDQELAVTGHGTCSYHQWDMASASAGAVAIHAALAEGPWNPDVIRTFAQMLAPDNVLGAASALIDPITWNGGPQVENGQHRICVARRSGVRELFVAR